MHPKTNDGKGNINNIVDNTNIATPQYLEEQRIEMLKSIIILKYIIEKSSKHFIPEVTNTPAPINTDKFSENFPAKSMLNTDAPAIPTHYKKKFNIDTNSRQYRIGNEKYLPSTISANKNVLSVNNANNSLMKIAQPHHINLYIYYFLTMF